MRGLFTAGVIDGMMEAGIVFDGAIGVSAGAVFGCNYKSNQPGRVLRYNLRFCKDPRYSSFRSLVTTGDLFGADFCYREIPDRLDPFDKQAYRENPMDFFVVGTDVHTGQPVYHNCLEGGEEDLDWFRASASMPLAARIVSVGGYDLLDGGIADSIPLAYLEEQGYDRNVVILTQPMGYVKTKNKALPLMRKVYRDYPALLDTLARRQDVYNETTAAIREKERRGMAVRSQVEVFDEGGVLLCTNRCTTLFPTLGGYGGQPMDRRASRIPDRAPDFVARDHIGAAQHLLYRLTGDTNLVHVDRAVAESRGLQGPFVHDLCAFGYACRLAIGQCFPGQPERLRRMYGAMKTVLYPDTPVELHLWQTGPGQGAFRLVNAATGQAILDRGELDWD